MLEREGLAFRQSEREWGKREREIANANERKSEGLGGVYIGKERAERERESAR